MLATPVFIFLWFILQLFATMAAGGELFGDTSTRARPDAPWYPFVSTAIHVLTVASILTIGMTFGRKRR